LVLGNLQKGHQVLHGGDDKEAGKPNHGHELSAEGVQLRRHSG